MMVQMVDFNEIRICNRTLASANTANTVILVYTWNRGGIEATVRWTYGIAPSARNLGPIHSQIEEGQTLY